MVEKQIDGQAELFHAAVRYQDTDPTLATPEVVITPASDSQKSEADELLAKLQDPELAARVHEQVKTDNRQRAQRNLHSPFARSGGQSYRADLRLGDVLPDFGIVKERDWDAAKEHAELLDRELAAKRPLSAQSR